MAEYWQAGTERACIAWGCLETPYCVDTVGLDAEMIRKYVQHQERRERRDEQLRLRFK